MKTEELREWFSRLAEGKVDARGAARMFAWTYPLPEGAEAKLAALLQLTWDTAVERARQALEKEGKNGDNDTGV